MHTYFGDNWKLLQAATVKLQSNFFVENNLAKNYTSKNYFYNFLRTTFISRPTAMHTYFGDNWKLLPAARVKLQGTFFAEKNWPKITHLKTIFTIFFGQLFLPTNCYAHLFWGQLEAGAGRQSEAAE